MPIKDVQSTNKQHAVPQNIMDVEFKIIGDLTMRQFFYLLICGGAAYLLFRSSLAGFVRWPLILFFIGIGLLLAFLPIEDRGLDEWITNFFKAVYSPTQRVWRKDLTIPSAFLYQNMSVVKQELITLAPTSSRRKLEEYLESQDSKAKIDPLDIPELEYIKKVHEAFMHEPAVSVSTTVVVEEPTLPVQPVQPVQPSPAPVKVVEEKPLLPVKEEPKLPTTAKEAPKPQEPAHQMPVQQTPKPVETIKKPQPVSKRAEIVLPRHGEETRFSVPLTPDRHSGRKFTNFSPTQGEIILPIRGERVLETAGEVEIENDIAEKAEQLNRLLEQIKNDEKYKQILSEKRPSEPARPPVEVLQPPVKQPVESLVDDKAKSLVESVREENAKLNREIERLKAELRQPQVSDAENEQKRREIKSLEEKGAQAEKDYQDLQNKIRELQEKLEMKDKNIPKIIVQKIFTPPEQHVPLQHIGPKQAEGQVKGPTYARIQPLTNIPNVISGVVKDQDRNALNDIVVLIKNEHNEPKRALKTNSLGQFSIAVPLANGKYILSADEQNKSGLSFDIINFEAKGEIIPPIELIGKKV